MDKNTDWEMTKRFWSSYWINAHKAIGYTHCKGRGGTNRLYYLINSEVTLIHLISLVKGFFFTLCRVLQDLFELHMDADEHTDD